jgi:hypothetical protein
MSDLLQSGQHPNPRHPDPDQLSAFAEQALPAHVYQETLAHLAICPDCRTIVALSLPVVEEVPRPAPVPQRKPWFSGWNLAWPAAVALAGLTFVIVNVQRTKNAASHEAVQSQVAGLREQAARPLPAPPPQASVQEAPPSHPAANAVVASPKPALPATSRQTITNQQITDLPITGRNTIQLPEAAAAADKSAASGGPVPAPQPNTEAVFRAPADAKVQTPSPAPAPSNSSSPVSVEASNQQIETTNAAIADNLPTSALPQPSATSGAQTQQDAARLTLNCRNLTQLGSLQRPLPSRLAILSIVSQDHRVLAIDTHNALFLSEDDGQHWKPVPTQWSGHAVTVNLAVARPASSPMEAVGFMHPAAPAAAAGAAIALPTPVITGIVTDPAGAVIPNATVILSNTQTQNATTAKTDSSGRYLATGLAAGAYQLEAQAPGFEKKVQTGLTLAPGQTLQSNLTLTVGAVTESVMVTADQLQIEPPSADKATDQKANQKAHQNAKLSAIKAARAAAPPIPAMFEIQTDTGARWTSPDGQHWQPQPTQK